MIFQIWVISILHGVIFLKNVIIPQQKNYAKKNTITNKNN